ncbi:acetyl-CoA C-acetyltransferase [Henriciella sp.]|uniref:acetyl-CoA C-acetyltransferase n=1 Tax=Henriciella sp. TaxID=1968823 RepID=UPI0026096110|nr:acetyl-CoA C-acetyltransferase [Henriciella sp.]
MKVYVVDGNRTPFIKARGKPGPFTAVDLAVQAGRTLLLRHPEIASQVEEVILGCGSPGAEATNPARVAALRMGLGKDMPGWTVQRNCGSGMQSVDSAFRYIRAGDYDCLMVGGTESLSHAPLLLNEQAVDWFAGLNTSRSLLDRVEAVSKFRFSMLEPVIGVEKGLTDTVVDLGMGQTAEILRHEWNIKRKEADAYAVESHKRLARAQENGWLDNEVDPVFSQDGEVFEKDDGVRPDSNVEKLDTLNPVFERPYGHVTAGNSSQITDGACWMLVASERFVDKHGLEPLGEIRDSHWAALSPACMGLGPVHAVTPILKRHQLGLGDIDLWELNEAFAHQVLACLKAWESDTFCKEELGLEGAMGEIDRERLNVDGGAISLGHPVGTSGARIILHALNAMRRRGNRTGIATECIGGGQGGGMLLEALAASTPPSRTETDKTEAA